MSVGGVRERFYTPLELENAIVVDSVGMIYGRVGGVLFREDYSALEVYIEVKVGETIVDEEELKTRLTMKGYELNGRETLEELVSLARTAGLEVPRRSSDRELRLRKAQLMLSEIRWIDRKKLVTEEGEERITVVLLKTPREASYRGVEPEPKPRSPTLERVKGKLVLSESKGILGVAGELTVGFGVPGIRVYTSKAVEREIAWISFVTALRRSGLREIAEAMVEIADPYRNPRMPYSVVDKAREVLERMNAPEKAYRILERSIVASEGKEIYTDVPWTAVRQVTDTIITA